LEGTVLTKGFGKVTLRRSDSVYFFTTLSVMRRVVDLGIAD
jgi:hypothetical protein